MGNQDDDDDNEDVTSVENIHLLALGKGMVFKSKYIRRKIKYSEDSKIVSNFHNDNETAQRNIFYIYYYYKFNNFLVEKCKI